MGRRPPRSTERRAPCGGARSTASVPRPAKDANLATIEVPSVRPDGVSRNDCSLSISPPASRAPTTMRGIASREPTPFRPACRESSCDGASGRRGLGAPLGRVTLHPTLANAPQRLGRLLRPRSCAGRCSANFVRRTLHLAAALRNAEAMLATRISFPQEGRPSTPFLHRAYPARPWFSTRFSPRARWDGPVREARDRSIEGDSFVRLCIVRSTRESA